MRKVIVLGVLAALGAALLVTPASASFDHHFNVIAKETSAKRTGPNTFRFKDKLFDPQNRRDQVGRDWVRCKFTTPQRAKCRAHIRLNGKIGGFGNISVRGRIGPDDNRLNVVRGTHDFNGVAGKVLFYDLNRNTQRLHFDLTR